VVFDWHEEKADAFEEVDTAEGCDAEVEEDAEDDCVWYQSQKRSQKDRQPHQKAYTESGNALI